MASEILRVPEEALPEVVAVIRAGLEIVTVSSSTLDNLLKWCQDEEDYLGSLEEQA